MTVVTQLNPRVAVTTKLGPGYAILVETTEEDQLWTVALDSRAIVTIRQEELLMARSYTYGRGISDAEMQTVVDRYVGSWLRCGKWTRPRRRRHAAGK